MRLANNKLLLPRNWGVIAEASLALATTSLATRLLPFHRYISIGAQQIERKGGARTVEAARIVEAIANRVPFRAVCLQRGIALQWMLRRRGIDAVLHYGIQLPKDEAITAHVWVSVDGEIILGGPQHEQFAEVARYPSLQA